jgi:hypothetical protein
MMACLLPLLLTLGCQGDEKKAPEKKAPETAKKTPEKKAPEKKAPEKKAPPARSANAKVSFGWPDDGAKVPPTFDVLFAVQDLEVVPAGTHAGDPSKGHHHVIVDGQALAPGTMVPKDDRHIHFGKGQTRTELTLTPGKHTLTLQFADALHKSYGPDLSATINVEVIAMEKAPRVFFVGLADGAKVANPVKLTFGIEGMAVRPAGEDPVDKTSGHHHIIVDGKALPVGQVVGKGAKSIHFGKGQTEAELTLEPGKRTLTMQLADGLHRSYGARLSATVNIEVE